MPKSKTALEKELREMKKSYKAICQSYFQALDEVQYWKGKTNDALNMADRLMSKLEAGLKTGNPARPEPVHASGTRATRRYWIPRRRKP